MGACSNIIMQNFSEIVEGIVDRGEETKQQMISMEFKNFADTLGSDNLSIVNEEILIDLVRRYINTRENIVPK